MKPHIMHGQTIINNSSMYLNHAHRCNIKVGHNRTIDFPSHGGREGETRTRYVFYVL